VFYFFRPKTKEGVCDLRNWLLGWTCCYCRWGDKAIGHKRLWC